MIAGAFGLYAIESSREIAFLQQQDARLSGHYAQLTQGVRRRTDAQREHLRLVGQVRRAAELTDAAPAAQLLAEVAAALPRGATLTALCLDRRVPPPAPSPASAAPDNFPLSAFEAPRPARDKHRTADEAWFPDVAVADTSLRVCGAAASQADVEQLLATLGRSALFSEARLLVSEIVSPAGADSPRASRRFQLLLTVRRGE